MPGGIATLPASPASVRAMRLARDIAGLASRGHWPSGRHVTELELADALSVSRTPVRAALRLLEAHGALEARPGRGFFLLRDGQTLPDLPLNLPATAEDELRASVLRDRIAGHLPASVTAGLLAARYRASRAVLERVLHGVAAEGLVAREAGHVWRFLPSLEGVAGVRASYELRMLVEPSALLLRGANIDPEEVCRQQRRHEDIRGALSRARRRSPTPAVLFELDAGFHEVLAGFSSNPLVLNLVRQQNALRRLLEFKNSQDTTRVLGWVQEHLSVLEALEQKAIDTASLRLRDHLLRALAVATGRLDDARPGPQPSRLVPGLVDRDSRSLPDAELV